MPPSQEVTELVREIQEMLTTRQERMRYQALQVCASYQLARRNQFTTRAQIEREAAEDLMAGILAIRLTEGRGPCQPSQV